MNKITELALGAALLACTAVPPAYAQGTAAYTQGAADWRSLKTWLDAQNGTYRDGANYWAANRNVPRSKTCQEEAEDHFGDEGDPRVTPFHDGCDAAKYMLDQIDLRRAEPQYRAGFNHEARRLPLNASVSQRVCLSYNGRITVTGTIIREVAPGLPNYESIAGGDKPEIYWVVRPMRPVCVDADPSEATEREIHMNPAMREVQEIQLVLLQEQYLQHEALIGKQVSASGILFGAHTGHHHAPLLMQQVEFGTTSR